MVDTIAISNKEIVNNLRWEIQQIILSVALADIDKLHSCKEMNIIANQTKKIQWPKLKIQLRISIEFL
jgi:hypothetical protein